MIFLLPPAGTAFFPTLRHFVDRRPGASLGFLWPYPAMFVAFLDVLRLTFLFVCVTGFVSTRHKFEMG
jgi:hypothetical protein